jgi:hypothetical protein
MMTRHHRILTLAALSLVAGCVATHPGVDRTAGDAVVSARSEQTLNPAGTTVTAVPGVEGRVAKESVERYYESFRTPPPTMNVINIGGSLTETQTNGR